MILSEMLSGDRVIADMQAEDAVETIEKLVGHLVATGALSPDHLGHALDALLEREEQGTTGIGGGVAIPHCFLEGIDHSVAIFGRSKDGINYGALDRSPVHFIFLFLVPKAQHALHLKTLAAVAKIMNSGETRKRLSEAVSSEEILEILTAKAAAV